MRELLLVIIILASVGSCTHLEHMDMMMTEAARAVKEHADAGR